MSYFSSSRPQVLPLSFTARAEYRSKVSRSDSGTVNVSTTNPGLTHQCLYFEQPHTFEQILFIQTAEPALVGHA